ncbi:MAG: serine--tRNA ligase [archaeon]|nr:serine--tRNA ligase [archaeon]
MLDIKLFREKPDLIKESEQKRFRKIDNVDKVIEYDTKWRNALKEVAELRRKRNELTKSVSDVYKTIKIAKTQDRITKLKKDAEDLKEESKKVGKEINQKEPLVDEYLQKRDEYRYKIGNILNPDVPIAEDEEGDITVRTHGKTDNLKFNPKSHVDLVEIIGCVNLKKASEIAGHRFYYLKHELVKLNLALLNYALDILIEEDFIPTWTPFFARHQIMKEAAELADFEEQLYKIEGEDLYLIATSEQTIAALHRNEVINENDLPIKYAGVSTCFRKEAGSHGRDTLGIFRVHQFEKIEQYVFCKPEESESMHKHMLETSEKIFKSLGIPYRVVNIASGELNDNAAMKYDLEAWFPGSNTYRELVSCSNCTDYQARKLNVRYGTLGDKESFESVHTLNSTAIATERTICCILENYQNEDGSITIPDVLIPYMGGIKTIPVRN